MLKSPSLYNTYANVQTDRLFALLTDGAEPHSGSLPRRRERLVFGLAAAHGDLDRGGGERPVGEPDRRGTVLLLRHSKRRRSAAAATTSSSGNDGANCCRRAADADDCVGAGRLDVGLVSVMCKRPDVCDPDESNQFGPDGRSLDEVRSGVDVF